MERIFDVNGKRFVTSLEWIPLTGKDANLSAKLQAKSRGCNYGVVRTIIIEDGPTVSQVGLFHQKLKGAFYSAAGQLANIHSSVIAIEKLGEDLFWLCVAENGRVLPGYDVVTSGPEISKLFQEISQDVHVDHMKTIMESSVALELKLDDIDLDRLVNKSPLQELQEVAPDANVKIKNLIGIPSAVYLGVAMVLVIGVMGGFWKYSEMEKQRELDALMAQDRMDLNKIESQVTVEKVIVRGPTDEELMRRARQEEITWLRDDFNSLGTLPALKQFYFLVQELPRHRAGWELATVRFDGSASDQLSALWKREGYGTPQSIRQSFGKDVAMSFTPDMSSARTAHKISLGSRGVDDILGYIKRQGIGHQAFATDLINNSLEFTSSVVQAGERKKPIEGLENKSLTNEPQLTMKMRKFEITGDNVDRFVVLMGVMERANNYLPETIEINRAKGAVRWKLTGTLYEE